MKKLCWLLILVFFSFFSFSQHYVGASSVRTEEREWELFTCWAHPGYEEKNMFHQELIWTAIIIGGLVVLTLLVVCIFTGRFLYFVISKKHSSHYLIQLKKVLRIAIAVIIIWLSVCVLFWYVADYVSERARPSLPTGGCEKATFYGFF